MIRFRPALHAFCGDPRYPRRLTITWTFDVQQENGLPTDDQSDELKDFEDSIQSALDPDRVGILAFVFTSDGLRVWNYYCGDMREVGNRINAALSDSPGLPITLESHSDVDWSEMKELLNQCRE